jgi:hypothetical protein
MNWVAEKLIIGESEFILAPFVEDLIELAPLMDQAHVFKELFRLTENTLSALPIRLG